MMDFFGMLIISGLMNGSIYGLVALGFVFIYKSSSVLNFAQGYMLMLGAYMFCFFKVNLGFDLPLALFCAMVCGFIVGALVERIALRPLIGQSLISMITVTIFLSLVLEGVASLVWGTYPLPYIQIFPSQTFTIGNLILTAQNVYAFSIAVISAIGVIIFFRFTRVGLAMQGVADGHQIMQSMGISVKGLLTISWGVAGVAATVGGVMLGGTLGFQLGLSHIGLLAIPAAFIGGLESPEGAILGGFFIGITESVISGYVGNAAGVPASFVILIVVMIFRPYGFFGLPHIERV